MKVGGCSTPRQKLGRLRFVAFPCLDHEIGDSTTLLLVVADDKVQVMDTYGKNALFHPRFRPGLPESQAYDPITGFYKVEPEPEPPEPVEPDPDAIVMRIGYP